MGSTRSNTKQICTLHLHCGAFAPLNPQFWETVSIAALGERERSCIGLQGWLLYSTLSELCAGVSDSWQVLSAEGRALQHIKRTKFYKRKKKLK